MSINPHQLLTGSGWNYLKTRPWLLSVLFLTGIFLALNHQLLTGQVVGIWDVNNQFLQYHILVADYARAGRLVYWDPWSNAGLPILGDPQVGIFSPLNVLAGMITGGTTFGFIFYWLSMWWLGGFGVLMLARHLQTPAWGGCVVALGFLFCGIYTGHAEHTSWIIGFSFLPLIIWRLDVALGSGRWQPALEAGALWGLSALAGYPGFTIITGCFAALWALGRVLFADSFSTEASTGGLRTTGPTKRRPTLRFALVSLTIVFLVGSVILCPTYFSFLYEGAGHHTRVNALSREVATEANALHPGALATLTTNYLSALQLSNKETLWPYTDVAMSSIYAGAAILTLGLLALFTHPRNRWQWWLFFLALLSLSCALGRVLPLRGWLYDWFYPMRFFRFPAIFRAYYVFTLSILALSMTRHIAMAIEYRTNRLWRRFFIGTVCLSFGALTVFFITRHFILNPGEGFITLFSNRFAFASFGLLHALVVWSWVSLVALLGWAWRSRLKPWSIPLLLLALAASDAYLTLKLSQGTMFSAGLVKRWEKLDEKHSATLDLTGNGLLRAANSCTPEAHADVPCDSLNNDQLITKQPVLNAYATEINDFHQQMVNNHLAAKLATGTSRFWFVREALQVQPTETNFTAWLRHIETTGAVPLVIHDPQELIRKNIARDLSNDNPDLANRLGSLPPLENIDVNLLHYRPDELAFNVQSLTGGWLLVTDRWARSWRAEINGAPAKIYGGNFIFRAIRMPQGRSRIRFTYHPFGFPWLIIASWGALGIIAISSVIASRRAQNKPHLNLN